MTQMVQKTMLLHLFLTSNCSFFSPPFLPVVCRGYVQQPCNVRRKENCWKIETRSVDFFTYCIVTHPFLAVQLRYFTVYRIRETCCDCGCLPQFLNNKCSFLCTFGIFIVLIFLGGYPWES